MLDIEKYRKQVERLYECIVNLESAVHQSDAINFSPFSTVDEITESHQQVERCEQTLIGQLNLMNIQNKEDLES